MHITASRVTACMGRDSLQHCDVPKLWTFPECQCLHTGSQVKLQMLLKNNFLARSLTAHFWGDPLECSWQAHGRVLATGDQSWAKHYQIPYVGNQSQPELYACNTEALCDGWYHIVRFWSPNPLNPWPSLFFGGGSFLTRDFEIYPWPLIYCNASVGNASVACVYLTNIWKRNPPIYLWKPSQYLLIDISIVNKLWIKPMWCAGHSILSFVWVHPFHLEPLEFGGFGGQRVNAVTLGPDQFFRWL